jgi:periplasmic protein TonB
MALPRISPEIVIAVASSVVLHAVWLVGEAKAARPATDTPAEVILEAEATPTPPPTEAPPAPPAETDKAEPVVPNAAARQPAAPAAALPAPAQAGKTLTAPDNDDSAVADFTLVQGSGQTYAGGTTSALGTSTTAVRGVARDGSPAAQRSAPAGSVTPVASGPDRSRGATPAVADWNCSRLYPTDPEAGDQATVLIAVTVLPSGATKSVTILRDPGHGFGAAARTCAMSQRFNAALDRQGSPVLATTPPITVRFTR